jgi:ATP-dependent DNA helicase RecG
MQDMSEPKAMQRLLEGDVGSGKTLVALLASLNVLTAGFDAILLAPTEILAQQHFQTASKLLSKQTNIALFTRSNHRFNKEELKKPELLKKLAGKKPKLIIATHAVLQKDISLPNTALVIIDEQHRFGVSQRKALLKATHRPHLLSMTATPIPRTLALSWYTNLTISRLTHIPSSRPPVRTVLVPENSRAGCYQTIRELIADGQQVFVVTPRVEETDSSELKSVKAEYERLAKTIFPKARVGMVHGQMKAVDKEAVMQQFYNHELDVLVATSVIEIGIDVPNATVMIIEGAERFGLAQLHQLRGRVGRGPIPSTCYLFTTDNNPADNERLAEFTTIRDGFTLAELDLKQRGFGNLFGTEQSGYQFLFNQFITPQLISTTTTLANKLLQKDPELKSSPELKKLVAAAEQHIHGE